MKKILKVLLFVVLALVAVVAVGAVVINSRGIPTYPVENPDYVVHPTPAKVERGKKLASMLCKGCHYNDETGKLSGREMKDAPEFGMLYSQNITHDKEYGIGNWTDGEILFLLRTGILPSGRYAPPYMAKLPYMSDDDIEAVICFLRSDDPLVQAANVPDKPCEPSFLTKALSNFAFKPLPFPQDPIPNPDTNAPVEWGRYLTYNLDCWTCHSPAFEQLNMGEPHKTPGFLSGGNESLKNAEGEQILSLNITPDKETGIGDWTEEEFVKAVKYGLLKEGPALRYPMEPYSQLTDEEAAAIYAYIQTVTPIKHEVTRSNIQN